MPKTFLKKTSGWVEIKSIFVKKTTGWTEIKNVFLKKTSGWLKVFTKSSLPETTTIPSIRTTNTGAGTIYQGPAATSPQTLNSNLFGQDGSYTNYTSIFGRKFTRGSSSSSLNRTTIVNDDRFTSAGGVTDQMRADCDDQYLFYELTVQNVSSADQIYPISSAIKMIKSAPQLGPFTTSLTGSSSPNSTLTLSYNLENYYYNSVDPATSKIKWWRSSNNTASGFLLKEQTVSATTLSSNSSSLTGQSTYTIDAINDNNFYIVVEIVGINSYTIHNGSPIQIAVYNSALVQPLYQFSFGNTLYVGSNGYIGLQTGGSVAGLSGSGRNINIWNEDLVQYRLQEYSDNSNYYLYFRAYRYQNPLVASAINALDYQIKFYTGQQYCDVYLVRKGSSVPIYLDSPGYYKNFVDDVTAGNTSGVLGPFSWSAGSVMRIYFNETSPATTSGISWTSISDSVWKDITTAQIDDSFTSVVTSANQQAATLTAPTITSVTPGPQGGAVTVNYTGGSGPFYQAYWSTSATAPTGQVTPDASGSSSSSLTDSTGPSSTATNYMYVRSVSTQAETSVGPSSLASSWSAGVQFNMTSTAVSQNTAPTATATSTGSTSTVKYLDSINWTTGSYTNAASITSVLLYSTSTSNLVSPGGNTNSSFRTANPYTIVPSDPAGTPYVFAVRDTVVGTNGTTYYFYSNQITSANADAVAFSYGSATSSSGGWTASVNSGTQSGATYSYVSATAGSGSVNSSTGEITASGLASAQSSTITVNKAVSGYNTASTTASGTSSAAPSGPTSPTGLSVTAGAVSGTLGTTLTRNSATNKTQSWSTATSQSATVSWTKGTGTGTITSDVKWNQSGATPGSGDSGTWNGVSGSSQSDTNSGGSTNYYWVRTSDGNGLKSAWVYAGSYTAASPSMSGLVIRIYRGNGSAFSTGSASSTSTGGSYTYSGLTNRDASPDFGHYAYASGTLNGVSKTATSSTV